MDSITQFTLGAVIGQIAGGRQYGIKAGLIGGVLGTFPDLDVFVGPLLYENPLDAELFHRAYTHSFFRQTIASFFFAGVLHRWLPKVTYLKRLLIIWLCFVTHSIIDVGTSYGVRALIPFYDIGISTHNISIVDPIYTLPMLAGLIISRIGISQSRGRKWLLGLTIFSTLYYFSTFGIKRSVEQVVQDHLPTTDTTALRSTPELGNTILRKVVAENEQNYYLTRYNIFLDNANALERYTIPKNTDILNNYDSHNLDRLLRRWPNYVVSTLDNDTYLIRSVSLGPIGSEYGIVSENGRLFGRAYNTTSDTMTQYATDTRGSIETLKNLRKRLYMSQSTFLQEASP